MSHELPIPGTTVILRQRVDADPMQWDFNNKKSEVRDTFVVVRKISGSEVVVQLKGQEIEAYIPIRFFQSKGCNYKVTPPIIKIPSSFIIETLPI